MWGKKTQTQKRGVDGEEAWNIILCYQNNITCILEKREFSHYSVPLSHDLTLFLTSLLKSSFISHRHRSAFICEGMVWCSFLGHLSQDVCPPVPISESFNHRPLLESTQSKPIYRSHIFNVFPIHVQATSLKIATDLKTMTICVVNLLKWKYTMCDSI